MKTKILSVVKSNRARIVYSKKIIKVVKTAVFGGRDRTYKAEPAKLKNPIQRSVYPENRPSYNEWCEEFKLSSGYHIKQTNNVVY